MIMICEANICAKFLIFYEQQNISTTIENISSIAFFIFLQKEMQQHKLINFWKNFKIFVLLFLFREKTKVEENKIDK